MKSEIMFVSSDCATYSLLLLCIQAIASLFSSSFALTYTANFCPTNTTQNFNTAFQTNLRILLTTLTSNASLGRDGSYQTIIGSPSSDLAAGVFLCRGDVSAATCKNCVATAASEITRRCHNQTESIIWYDECMVAYTNDWFDPMGADPKVNLWDNKSVSTSDFENFNRTLFALLNGLAENAVSSESTKKFATGEAEDRVGSWRRVYGMVQCVPSASNDQCETCLKHGIGTLFSACCEGKQGARALLAWCNIRYELYQFYNTTLGPSTPLVPSPAPSGKKNSGPRKVVLIPVVVSLSIILLFSLSYFVFRRIRKNRKIRLLRENFGDERDKMELLQFNFLTVEAATNKFSSENKIGKGGFGEVYKGILIDGREIAVKKLSPSSGQGVLEFKNEVLLVAKLQHRNLVTLLGFCLETREKMLIYEFLPNKSLDYFLFDPRKSRILNWFERYKIIEGIAQGILYLHEHSRLKVIHRDLKPSNVLLDENMNPKISDFGMARMIAIDQDRGNTKRVVGTFGYMAPEYVKRGYFSEKSDVFSFGVIILEVICAKRNIFPIVLSKNHNHGDKNDDDDLLSYIWRQWRNGTPLIILDEYINDFNDNEVIKCIQIGLLCVQEKPDDRPTMTKVVSYLNSPLIELPLPREPTNFRQSGMIQKMATGELISSSAYSINEMSLSKIIPR